MKDLILIFLTILCLGMFKYLMRDLFVLKKIFFVFWRTFGVQNEKLEDLEDKLANWRTSSELEDTCGL